uniref:Uncharacterized protein n=1 Tax=Arcella intermedia TaxID=1963864 RepID=A0A6B2LQ09_9EUKA
MVGVEEKLIETGKQEGINDGRRIGRENGLNSGYASGFELANEIGYYAGCVEGWLLIYNKFPQQFSTRTQKTLLQIKELIGSFHYDPTNPLLTDHVQKIRTKFKVLASQVGHSQKYLIDPEAHQPKPHQNNINF